MKEYFRKRLSGVLAILVAAAAAPSLKAQQADDYSLYSSDAKEQSMLYRGRLATSYANIHFNGTYYWTSREYAKGTVCYNGKVYEDVLCNVDACAQELLVRYSPAMPEVVVKKEYVPWFTMDGCRFINGSLSGIGGAEGYYKVLKEKDGMLLQQVRKSIKQSADNVNGDAIGYNDPAYNPNIHSYFSVETRWYVVKDGKLKGISRRKARKIMANGK